jgi:hypothetical protein
MLSCNNNKNISIKTGLLQKEKNTAANIAFAIAWLDIEQSATDISQL